MRKEWSTPVIKNSELKETKDIVCPYIQNDETMLNSFSVDLTPEFTAEQCCPCEFYSLCKKDHKYSGACNS